MQDLLSFFAQHSYLSTILFGVVFLLLGIEFIRTKQNIHTVQPAEAIRLINHENAAVLDLRPESAYFAGHIINAINLPQLNLNQPKKLEKYKNKPIIIITAQPTEARKIIAELGNIGFRAYTLSQGMQSWIQADMPIVKKS